MIYTNMTNAKKILIEQKKEPDKKVEIGMRRFTGAIPKLKCRDIIEEEILKMPLEEELDRR